MCCIVVYHTVNVAQQICMAVAHTAKHHAENAAKLGTCMRMCWRTLHDLLPLGARYIIYLLIAYITSCP